jgi:transcription initiation factor TFIIA large subunit
MPWDPPPHHAAPPASNHPGGIKSEVKGQPGENVEGVQIKTEVNYESQIKQDIKYEHDVPHYPALNGYQGNAINPMAGHRAAGHLLERFGPQANASIRAAGLPQQPRPLSLPGQQPSAQQQPQQQRPQHIRLPGQNLQRPSQPGQYPQGSLNRAQVDGASAEDAMPSMQDRWNAFVLGVRATTPEQRTEADKILREQVLADEEAEQVQLLIPESQRRRLKQRQRPQKQPIVESSSSTQAPMAGMQVDGGDDSADEDAINSDLDDPEEDLDGDAEEEEGPLGEMILCTWDKVNRVKNKVTCSSASNLYFLLMVYTVALYLEGWNPYHRRQRVSQIPQQ